MNLPNDTKAERAFLAMLMKHPAYLRRFEGVIRPDDFYSPQNALIYDSMLRLFRTKELAMDCVGVIADLRDRNKLQDAGGVAGVTALQAYGLQEQIGQDDAFLVKGYAEILLDLSRRREGYKILTAAGLRAAQGEDLSSILATAKEALADAAHDIGDELVDAKSLTALWTDWYLIQKDRGECTGIESGIPLLDYKTGGFQPSTLVILGARPNMGKTALALNFAVKACKSEKKVAFFSLEMTSRELISRILAAEGNIDARHTNIPALIDEKEKTAVDLVFNKLEKWGIYVDDTYSLPVSKIAARSRRLKNSSGLDIIFIDHLNYIGSDGNAENRTNELRKITAALKGLAKELEIPVVCLCQLSRGLESRPDKRPNLSDLRESGTIEQDADIVLLLYRDGYYTKDEGDNSAELNIAKHRGGETGVIDLIFDGQHQKFSPAPWKGKAVRAEMEDIPK